MTKLHDQDAKTLSSKSVLKFLENNSAHLMKIDQRWDNRLIPNEIMLPKDHIIGRVSLLLDMGLIGGTDDFDHAGYLTINFHPDNGDTGHCNDTNVSLRMPQDEQVMFVPITQIVECAEGMVPPVGAISVRLYNVCQQTLSFGDITCYRSLVDGSSKIFSIGADGHSLFIGLTSGIHSADKTHPGVIKCGPEVAHDIPSKKGYFQRDGVQVNLVGIVAALKITLTPHTLSLSIGPSVADLLQIRDVAVGPFDL